MIDVLRSVVLALATLAVGLPPMSSLEPSPQGMAQEPTREAVMEAAQEIMMAAQNCALVTNGADGRPQARMMNPFAPEPGLAVWMATNPSTRKVAEIREDPRVTLLYYDPADPGYVTLVGEARLVDDPQERAARWKDEWDLYYPGGAQGDNYVLIEFIPRRIEVVSVKFGIADDPLAWKPAIVELGNR